MADNISILDAVGATKVLRTTDVAGIHYQHFYLSVGGVLMPGDATFGLDVDVTRIPWQASRGDTYTAIGNGTAVDVSTRGVGKFGLQVKQTGTVTSWTVLLQASLDNVNFDTVLTHMKTGDGTETVEGDGKIAWSGPNDMPSLYFRSRCEAITLGVGTNVVATIIGTP